MRQFVEKVDLNFLESIHNGNINTPTMYYHKNKIVRQMFWERLNVLAKFIQTNNKLRKNKCLDFGGGSGVFLPTLSSIFEEVILIDLDSSQANIIKEKYNLQNVTVLEDDIYALDISDVDCIVVADVIEHFEDTRIILEKLKSLMTSDTYLLSSLPTENYFYDFIRLIGRQEKPWDHYFGAKQVEKVYEDLGFVKISSYSIPFKPFNMFSITQWTIE